MEEVLRSLSLFKPELALTAGLLLVVLVDAWGGRLRDVVVRALTAASLAAALALSFDQLGVAPGQSFSGMLAVDPMGAFFKVVLVAASLLIVLAFGFAGSRELRGLGQGEFYALLLALTLSNLLLSAANDITMLYLALEMVSITSYVMVAYMKGDRMSNEASLKYVLFGAFSTGAMLYGLSLLYGFTGASSFEGIREAVTGPLPGQARFTVFVCALLVFAGFGFKTAAVPFHFWCPDVYQGAPTPVTAFLSVAPKAAGFAVMVRFFFGGYSASGGAAWDLRGAVEWPQLLMIVSVATMTIGNVAALTQTNMKRLLAYSSIAHAGYIMMGVVALSAEGVRALMVYLVAYLVMNLGAFLVVTLVHNHEDTFDLRDYPGLYRRAPLLTLAMAVFLLSLMGIPPLVGFMGKLFVFGAVIDRGPAYWWYAVVGALNAAVAAYYYARVLKTMVMDEGDETKPAITLPLGDRVWLTAFTLANLAPLFAWPLIEDWTRSSLTFWAGR
jgi:NADH-quinone oxidoreductase subunit N